MNNIFVEDCSIYSVFQTQFVLLLFELLEWNGLLYQLSSLVNYHHKNAIIKS